VILLTGSTGLIGSALLPKLLERDKVAALYHKSPPKITHENLIVVKGDLANPDSLLALDSGGISQEITEVIHSAGVINLSSSDKTRQECLDTNLTGTANLLHYMEDRGVRRLKYVSTAYLNGQNDYEKSKMLAERMVIGMVLAKNSWAAILKPSIVIGEYPSGALPDDIKPGAFYQFVGAIARVHENAEKIRRKAEHTMHLPPKEPVIHIKGNPEGTLNLIPVNTVADAILSIDSPRVYYLTNPDPPKLSDLAVWVGELVNARIVFETEPKLSWIDKLLARLTKDFSPYLQGNENFPSDISCPTVDREFIQRSLKHLGY
jgi:nucleoside-diphosphate-sugar epimerase